MHTTPCPDTILNMRAIMDEEIRSIERIAQIDSENAARWRNFKSIMPLSVLPSDAEIDTIHRGLRATIEASREALQVDGLKPEVDINDVVEALLGSENEFLRSSNFSEDCHLKYWRRFDPVTTWEYIKSLFPPENVQKQAAVIAAKAFKNALRLYRNDAPKISGGRAIIEISAYSRERYTNAGRYYSSLDVHPDIIAYAETFIKQTQQSTEMAECFRQLMGALNEARQYSFTFTSRDKINFPAGGQIIFFNECIKVYLPLKLAQDLFVFLAEHGQGN